MSCCYRNRRSASARLQDHEGDLIDDAMRDDYRPLFDFVRATENAALSAIDPIPGSRICVGAVNTVDHLIAILAILAAGKVWVPLNWRNPAAELNRIIAFTDPSIVLAEPAHLGTLDLAGVKMPELAVPTSPTRAMEA